MWHRCQVQVFSPTLRLRVPSPLAGEGQGEGCTAVLPPPTTPLPDLPPQGGKGPGCAVQGMKPRYSGLHLYEEAVLGFPLPLRERDRVRGCTAVLPPPTTPLPDLPPQGGKGPGCAVQVMKPPEVDTNGPRSCGSLSAGRACTGAGLALVVAGPRVAVIAGCAVRLETIGR